MQKEKVNKSKMVAIVAIFAALNALTDSFASLPEFPSGVWYSWNFLMTPLTGIVLGPSLGFASNLIGVIIGHYVYFIDALEFLFTIGAPIGAAVSALFFRGNWKPVLIYYIALFAAYFATPVAWQLPLWGMWDTHLAFALLIATIFLMQKGLWNFKSRKPPFILAVAAFIGLEADVLFRIFLFIPCQTYNIYGFNLDALQGIWAGGAFITPIKVILSTVTTVAIGHPLLKMLRNAAFLTNHCASDSSMS